MSERLVKSQQIEIEPGCLSLGLSVIKQSTDQKAGVGVGGGRILYGFALFWKKR